MSIDYPWLLYGTYTMGMHAFLIAAGVIPLARGIYSSFYDMYVQDQVAGSWIVDPLQSLPLLHYCMEPNPMKCAMKILEIMRQALGVRSRIALQKFKFLVS